jgi:hypothetical protein
VTNRQHRERCEHLLQKIRKILPLICHRSVTPGRHWSLLLVGLKNSDFDLPRFRPWSIGTVWWQNLGLFKMSSKSPDTDRISDWIVAFIEKLPVRDSKRQSVAISRSRVDNCILRPFSSVHPMLNSLE